MVWSRSPDSTTSYFQSLSDIDKRRSLQTETGPPKTLYRNQAKLQNGDKVEDQDVAQKKFNLLLKKQNSEPVEKKKVTFVIMHEDKSEMEKKFIFCKDKPPIGKSNLDVSKKLDRKKDVKQANLKNEGV